MSVPKKRQKTAPGKRRFYSEPAPTFEDVYEDPQGGAFWTQLLKQPAVEKLLGHATARLNQTFDRAVTAAETRFTQPKASGEARNPPPPGSKPGGGADLLAARATLHIRADEPLSAALIKTRKKALATLFHPDKDPNAAHAMTQINAAATLLLKHVK